MWDQTVLHGKQANIDLMIIDYNFLSMFLCNWCQNSFRKCEVKNKEKNNINSKPADLNIFTPAPNIILFSFS